MEEKWLQDNFHSTIQKLAEPDTLEKFICDSSYGFVKDFFTTETRFIAMHEVDIPKLMLFSALYFVREDVVRLLNKLFPNFGQQFARDHIEDIAKTISKAEKYPHVQEKLTNILNFFPNQLGLVKSPKMLDMIHQLAGLHGFVQMITTVAENLTQGHVEKAIDIMTKNTEMCQYDVLSKAARSSIVKEKISHVLTLLLHPLRNMKYPEELKNESLLIIHKLAALTGFVEIVEIISEKFDKDYIEIAIEIMNKNTDWINKDALRFLGSKIDQNDVKTFTASKVSSMLIAAKKRHLQFIVNFAPFSTTVHEKDQSGKTTLLLVLDLDDLSSTDQKLQEKAAKILMETMQKSQMQRIQQQNQLENLEENKTETDSDYCFEDSENDSVDLYESESD